MFVGIRNEIQGEGPAGLICTRDENAAISSVVEDIMRKLHFPDTEEEWTSVYRQFREQELTYKEGCFEWYILHIDTQFPKGTHSDRFGPQLNQVTGTIGALQLAKRYCVSEEGSEMLVWPSSQGRYTHSLREEAQKRMDIAQPGVLDAPRLFVRAVWCYPTHFDPVCACVDDM